MHSISQDDRSPPPEPWLRLHGPSADGEPSCRGFLQDAQPRTLLPQEVRLPSILSSFSLLDAKHL